MNNDWKDRLGIVFSTNNDFDYSSEEENQANTLPKNQQKLHVYFERAGRKGKIVTLITGFIGKDEDLKALEKLLKTKCGTGGTCKNGNIEIQGNMVEKVKNILKSEGYFCK